VCSIVSFVGWNDSVDFLEFLGVVVSSFDAFLVNFVYSF